MIVDLIHIQTPDGCTLDGALQRAPGAPTIALDEVGTTMPRADIASMRHETQYTRLFRS